MDRPAIVIVTYKRQDLLAGLLASIEKSTVAPWRIVVVDNEDSPETARMMERFSAEVDALWPATEPDELGGTSRAVYVPMAENTGGSGGFFAGVERAYMLGAQWFWVMDDDVVIESEGLARLDAWTSQADVIQGRRYDFDGGPFYWQYHLWQSLGIYNPLARSSFDGAPFKPANVMCFEGALFSRRVVDTCGLPDPRFFIYWDDAVYGYVASRHVRVILVPDFVLRRCREVKNIAVGSVRQLNSTSDMTRYYILRNRGYIARYLQRYGDYRRIAFGVGTALTFAKELIRIVAVDRKSLVSGVKRLVEGWKDARKIYRDPTWEPMPPLG